MAMERSLDLRRDRPFGQGTPDGCDRFASFVGVVVLAAQAGLVCYGFAVATGTVSRPEWPTGVPPAKAPPVFLASEPRLPDPQARPAVVTAPPVRPVPVAETPAAYPMAVPVACADLRPIARAMQRRFGRGVAIVPEGPTEKATEVGCGGYSVRSGRRAREVARYLGRKTQVQVRRDGDGIFHVSPVRGREALASIPGLEP